MSPRVLKGLYPRCGGQLHSRQEGTLGSLPFKENVTPYSRDSSVMTRPQSGPAVGRKR